MKIKELQRTVNIAWSPEQLNPIMLAAGTAAQQLDSSFSTNAALEVYALNLSEPGLDLELKATAPSSERFHKVIWGAHGMNGAHPSGVIVGGCEGGLLQIYSASKLVAGEEALLAKQDKHIGAVRALDLNPFQMNLLASGASESEIYIWDLNNTETPMSPGTKSQPMEDVQCVAWNRQVQHILASSFSTRCVVWDLRKNEPIIKLSDSQSRLRWGHVCWHPEVATQLCLASEEDQAPIIQMWDLRFATAPLKVFQRHQRGVLSLAWCPKDPELLISCAKDANIYCWNASSEVPGGEVISELPCSTQWNFNVSWCPKNPAIIASSSFDGYVSVHSIMGGSQQQVQTTKKIADSFPGMDNFIQAPTPVQNVVSQSHDPVRAPKWLKRPVGARFGFGGKLISFDHDTNASQQNQPSVYVSQLVTEMELVSRSRELERAVQTCDFVDYCKQKADGATDQHNRYVWYFLKANFENDTRSEILNLLGYKPDDMANKLNKYVSSANATNENAVENLTDQMAGLSRGVDGSAAFDAIAAGTKTAESKEPKKSVTPFKINTTDDQEGLITQAILSGNVEAAVELCIEAGRMADAIVIAITGGSELLARTQFRYLQQSEGSLSMLISSLITEDWSNVVQQCSLDSWKKALVGVLTHCSNEEMVAQCSQLGSRLESSSRLDEAVLCYICAGDISSLVRAATSSQRLNGHRAGLIDVVELVTVMQGASAMRGQSVEICDALADLLTKYALLLAGQGSLEAALSHLGKSEQPDIVELRQRLYCALGLHDPYAQPANMVRNNNPVQTRPGASLMKPAQAAPAQNYLQPVQPALPPVSNQLSYTGAANQTTMFNTGLPGQNLNQTPVQQPWQQSPAVPPVSSYMNPGAPATSFMNPVATPTGPPPMTQPPRPGSVGSSHGSTVGTRSKYVLDPSVQSAHSMSYGSNSYSNPIPPMNQSSMYPGPTPISMANPQPQPNMINPPNMMNLSNTMNTSNMLSQAQTMLNTPTHQQQPGMLNPQQSSMLHPQGQPGMLNSQMSYGQQMPLPEQVAPPPVMAARTGPTPPPGWNDPPVVASRRHSSKQEYQSSAPITHPLFGTQDPNLQQQNQQYQQYGALPPTSVQQTQFNTGLPTQQQQQYQQQPQQNYNGYGDAQQQQQQQQFNQQQQPGNPGNARPTQSNGSVQPEPVQPKAPLPEEHVYLQVVLDELRNKCADAANNPQLKRKLEDVSKKLEALYDMLRDNRLSPNTLQVLHQMVQMIQIGDYAGGLGLHTALVSGPDFAQIACFMPGLKVLLISASQLQVVLR